MKLKYKILWIEDTPTSIRRDKNKIIEYILELGFECADKEDVVVINSFTEFEENIGYEKTADYDLLLVDLDLGKTSTKDEGETIIRKIREEKVYSEIVFYSSQYEALQAKLNEHFVEGIFTSSREELADKVESIINVTIKKIQDVNNLRGLIMAEVAELDRMKEAILKKYSEKNQCGTIEKYLIEKLKKSYDDNLKDVAKYTSSSINDIFDKLYVDSDKRARAIKKVENSFDEDSYRKNILKTRNKFAHIEECDGVDENGMACKVIKDIPFTEKKCIEIRKEIRNYKKILEDIKNAI